GPCTRGSDIYRNLVFDCLMHYFGKRRPSDRGHGLNQLVSHQVHGLAEKEDLNLMPRLCERVGMKKGKTGFGRFVRPPSALDQHLHVAVSFTKPEPLDSSRTRTSGFAGSGGTLRFRL